jgi:hypothetical protein
VRFLILAHAGDATATQVASRLLQRHRSEDTRLVLLEEIVSAPRWTHTLNGAKADTILTLRDGTELRNNQIGVVFNRLQYIDMSRFALSETADREYALMEMYALILSWLKALPCQIINPLSSQNLAGPIHSSLAWQQLAGKADLPTVRVRLTSSLRRYSASGLIPYPVGPVTIGNVPAWLSERVGELRRYAFVAGEHVLGDVPTQLIPGCAKLAALSGFEVLLIYFASLGMNGGWKFNGIDTCPAVTQGPAIDAIVKLLEARS